jgi:hypothetical protein
LKLIGGEEVHKLRENGSALVHLLPPEQAGKQQDGAKREAKN